MPDQDLAAQVNHSGGSYPVVAGWGLINSLGDRFMDLGLTRTAYIITDENVMGEAHKAHVFDAREEGVSKNWATQYNFPAVRRGLFKRDLRPTARVEGLWWPLIWNTDRPNLADIRVREALWLLFDFDWTNRALFYNFYDKGISFFQVALDRYFHLFCCPNLDYRHQSWVA